MSKPLAGPATATSRVQSRVYDFTVTLQFHREAESLADALRSAVKQVERAGFTVSRVSLGADALKPMTEEENRQRAERAIRAMDEIAAIGSEEEQTETLEVLLKALDEEPL